MVSSKQWIGALVTEVQIKEGSPLMEWLDYCLTSRFSYINNLHSHISRYIKTLYMQFNLFKPTLSSFN